MQQQKLIPAYGMTKLQWEAHLADMQERSAPAAPKRDGLIARIKKRFH
jgi:hypothetical protein